MHPCDRRSRWAQIPSWASRHGLLPAVPSIVTTAHCGRCSANISPLCISCASINGAAGRACACPNPPPFSAAGVSHVRSLSRPYLRARGRAAHAISATGSGIVPRAYRSCLTACAATLHHAARMRSLRGSALRAPSAQLRSSAGTGRGRARTNRTATNAAPSRSTGRPPACSNWSSGSGGTTRRCRAAGERPSAGGFTPPTAGAAAAASSSSYHAGIIRQASGSGQGVIHVMPTLITVVINDTSQYGDMPSPHNPNNNVDSVDNHIPIWC